MAPNIKVTPLNTRAVARGWRLALLVVSLAAPLAFGSLAARAQSYGYSYMHLVIGGQPVINLVHDQKYQGWLQVEGVRATLTVAIKKSAGAKPSNDIAEKVQKAEEEWVSLPQILVSGRAGAGKLQFGPNDEIFINDERETTLSPLIVAQEQKTVIDSAELDLYEEDGGAFIGKYRLHGIRVLKFEDVPASACAMYLVTTSFQSVEKI